MTDKTTPTLGKLITGKEQRDAIHIAVAPVVATEKLNPGQRIKFSSEVDTTFVCATKEDAIGIVDPFLTGTVKKGEHFWMFLFPQTITSLRHDWTHPAFDNLEHNKSVLWMKSFSSIVDIPYDELISALKKYITTGDYRYIGFENPDELFKNREDLWTHFENITGIVVNPEAKDEVPFACSC